ncbi:hypothetical protein ROHU_026074 [Labeo rohita]|uniref:Uncharacterized protein n=1 Tax=Labeo rohita TaxID=84645 RepID=A0A498MCW1_LABRO|nr:hypothetical protein ROHU_026074 [Labeo rohita]
MQEWTLLQQRGSREKAPAGATLLRQCGNTEEAPAGADTAAAGWKYGEGSCGSGHCCGSMEIQGRLLREWTLLWQCRNTEKACAGVDTAEAVGKWRERLLWERTLLRQCGNTGKVGKTEKTPAGADAAVAVWECRKGSCGSGHCCGSVEIQGRLLRERALLRQCRSIEKGSCGSRHCSGSGEEYLKSRYCCGSGEIQKRLLREWGAAGVVFKVMSMVGLKIE